MKIDLYTKTILTVIAICLVWISLGGPSVLTPISAQTRASGYQRVVVAGWVDLNGVERDFNDGLPVRVSNPPR
jgi:hypothetical protein